MPTDILRADSPEPHNPSAGFFARPFVQDLLPFITSLALHLGLIAIGLLTYKAVTVVIFASREPQAIPESIPFGLETNDTKIFPGPNDGDPTRQYMRDDIASLPPVAQGFGLTESKNITAVLTGGGAGNSDDNLIAVGAQSSAFGKGNGTGSGIGDGTGSGGDAGMTPFGPPGGGSRDVGTVVFPRTHGASKIVFLCDSSGSMMNKFDTLRVELRKAIDTLKPNQSFDVIFFSGDSYVALDKQLLQAVPENKRRAYDFLEKMSPHDSSDPLPGLRIAFQTGPELIYMLTDGDFPNNNHVLEETRKLNAAGRKVRINTIAFMDRGEEYEKLLKQVADENAGLFKFVGDADLQR